MSDDNSTRLLIAVLDELREINGKLVGQSEARSSVQVNTSTRGWDITTKCYTGSPITEAGDAAVTEYLRVRQMLEDALMGKGQAA